MTRSGALYTLATAAAALLVGLLGSAVTGGAGRTGVWMGAGLAFLLQVAVFWLLFVWLLPNRLMLAHGLGVMGRFAGVGLMALLWVPLLAVPAAPTLFSLVAVFFVSTAFEPLFLKPDLLKRR